MRRLAALFGGAVSLALTVSPVARAQDVEQGRLQIATHRGDRTFVYIAAVPELPPQVRDRLIRSAAPRALPPSDGASERTVVSELMPIGTPFATWSGRALLGSAGSQQVCSRSIGRLVLMGAVPGSAEPSDEAMRASLANGVVAGELDDRIGACARADLFHDPDTGSLFVADATTLETTTPAGRDEIYGGIGRLRLQPEWVAAQVAFLASRPKERARLAWDPTTSASAPHPEDGGQPEADPGPDAGPKVSWDGSGARAVRFALGVTPYIAAVSVSPGCAKSVARLFHARNQPILIWPSLTFESPRGSLPTWVADLGDPWPVIFLDGALYAPDGDHYVVAQRFPGTPAGPCSSP